MKCHEYSWEISDGTGPLTLLLTRHLLWPPQSETAINPATAPEMLETEALKKWLLFLGVHMEHPNKSGFQETKYPPCITVRWNPKWLLAEKSSSSKYCCYKTQGLDSPRKPLGAMLISHGSTQLPGAVPVPWRPQPWQSLLCHPTQEQPSPSKNNPMLPAGGQGHAHL